MLNLQLSLFGSAWGLNYGKYDGIFNSFFFSAAQFTFAGI
jgi:hypothetical protein